MNIRYISRLYIFAIAFVGTILCGCNNSDSKVIEIVEERDSLKAAYEISKKQLSVVNGMIGSINKALDSIMVEEDLLFVNPHSEAPIGRNDVLHNLQRYEYVLRHQQTKISELEKMISNKKEYSGLQELVDHMKSQLADKDAQIARLRSELSKKDVNISQLRKQVASQKSKLDQQSATIEELDRKSTAQTKALARQDEIINNCYVMIGSKKELKRKGVVNKKKIVSDAALDKSKFVKVDIRKFREISFEAKRPRILTNMPQSSYNLVTNGDRNFTLKITDANAFWSISNYLVIQTD
ncbi:MAG: hypothetical protein Q4D41_13040 [Prevotellaceae bacterium]|nr:hypothetical protein [Prevotellaceae bacterium]